MTVEQITALIGGVTRRIGEEETAIRSYTRLLNYLPKVPDPELQSKITEIRAEEEVHRRELQEQKERLEKKLQEMKLAFIKST